MFNARKSHVSSANESVPWQPESFGATSAKKSWRPQTAIVRPIARRQGSELLWHRCGICFQTSMTSFSLQLFANTIQVQIAYTYFIFAINIFFVLFLVKRLNFKFCSINFCNRICNFWEMHFSCVLVTVKLYNTSYRRSLLWREYSWCEMIPAAFAIPRARWPGARSTLRDEAKFFIFLDVSYYGLFLSDPSLIQLYIWFAQKRTPLSYN